MYARAVLAPRFSAVYTTAVLTALYAFLYVLLQIDDYALLIGRVALFAILASVMFLTRRIDWYALPDALDRSADPGGR